MRSSENAGPSRSSTSAEESGRRRNRGTTERREFLRSWIRNASFCMLFVYIVQFICSVTIFTKPDSSFSIPFSLGVAYCGIVGSQRQHRDILSCFYICCVASICLYFITTLVQIRRLIQGLDASSAGLFLTMGLETALMLFQLSGGIWARELVKDHLLVQYPENPQTYTGSFTLDFVQAYERRSNTLDEITRQYELTQNMKYSIESIPVQKYSKKADMMPQPVMTTDTGDVEIELSQLSLGDVNKPEKEKPVVETTPVQVQVQQSFRFTDGSNGAKGESNRNGNDAGDDEDDEELCVICQEEFLEGDDVKVLNCKHLFHATCIDAWLERSMTCPMCCQEVPLLQKPGTNQDETNNATTTNSDDSASPPAENLRVSHVVGLV